MLANSTSSKSITVFPKASELNPGGALQGKNQNIKTLSEMHSFVKKHAWSPFVFKDDIRKSANFISVHFLAIDIDNALTLGEARRRLKKLGLQYSITLSRNHQKIKYNGTPGKQQACDRFRITVPLAEKITNAEMYKATLENFINQFPEADSKCFDLARFFFASTGIGTTYINSQGPMFPISNPKANDIKQIPTTTSRARIVNGKSSASHFIKNAHTGMPGNFNQGLYTTAFMLAKNGKPKEEIIDFTQRLISDQLDNTDLRTIQSAVSGAADCNIEQSNQVQNGIKKNADQAYFENTYYFLKTYWVNKYITVTDEFGSKLILEIKPNKTVICVGPNLLLSEATQIFFNTPYLRKPSKIAEAITNFLNLQPTLKAMPKSIVLQNDSEIAFNRLEFEPIKLPTPLFNEFLERCTNATALCAFIYSLFIPRSNRQQYIWLYGQGNDGKSSLARLLRRLLGSAYHADRAGGAKYDKHYTASFVGKRLAVYSDSNCTTFVKSELFKELSGGDAVKIDPKYLMPFNTILDAKFIFLSNILPDIGTQKSDQRRIILCELKTIAADTDSQYEDKLWEEREGILWKCKIAYEQTTKNNGEIAHQSVDAYELGEDSEVYYKVIFSDHFVLDQKSQITPEEFYRKSFDTCKKYNVRFEDFKAWVFRVYGFKAVRSFDSGEKRLISGLTTRNVFVESNTLPANHPIKNINSNREDI